MKRRIAIVTGAGRLRGLGAAILRAFADEGIDLYFTYWTAYDRKTHGADADEPFRLREELLARGVRAECGEWDLSDPSVPSQIMDEAEAKLGPPTILVNNACHWEAGGLENLTADHLDRHYAVNVRAPLLLGAEFVKRFSSSGGGRIINISSGQSLGPMPGELAYAVTKAVTEIFTRHVAAEAARKGITVNAVNPGPTDTGWMTEEIRRELLPRFPMGRTGLPEDAARLVRFLASPEAEWITGQVIHSEGGFVR
jgi:3-oxoacyl-[acyl-carrier protein] reductase